MTASNGRKQTKLFMENFDFEATYNSAPDEVKAIFEQWQQEWEDHDSYEALHKLNSELNAIGWEIDYYLDGSITKLQRLCNS